MRKGEVIDMVEQGKKDRGRGVMERKEHVWSDGEGEVIK